MNEKTPSRSTSRPRGRPSYKPTNESRRAVEEMKFCGESENTIARALGIDPDTLRKHFADELADGHAQRRKEVVGLLFKTARKGNVSAIKKLEELGRAAGAAEAVEKRAKPEPKLGKKEERQEAAKAVGGRLAVPPGPRLAVSNP